MFYCGPTPSWKDEGLRRFEELLGEAYDSVSAVDRLAENVGVSLLDLPSTGPTRLRLRKVIDRAIREGFGRQLVVEVLRDKGVAGIHDRVRALCGIAEGDPPECPPPPLPSIPRPRRIWPWIGLALIAVAFVGLVSRFIPDDDKTKAESPPPPPVCRVAVKVTDTAGAPLNGADLACRAAGGGEWISQGTTELDGRLLPPGAPTDPRVEIACRVSLEGFLADERTLSAHCDDKVDVVALTPAPQVIVPAPLPGGPDPTLPKDCYLAKDAADTRRVVSACIARWPDGKPWCTPSEETVPGCTKVYRCKVDTSKAGCS